MEYFAPEVQNGESFARMSVPAVHQEVQYWSSAVVVYVLGAFPPYSVMNRYDASGRTIRLTR